MTVENYYKDLINVESSELYKRYISDEYVEEYRQACVKILVDRGDFLNEENIYKEEQVKNVVPKMSYNKHYNLITAFVKMFKKYSDFSGRCGRGEFWCSYIMHLLILFFVAVMQRYLVIYSDGVAEYWLLPTIIGIAYILVSIIPVNALAVRRLHDVGENGWFLLLQLVPYIGAIILLVFLLKDSQTEENKYGKNPNIADEESAKANFLHCSNVKYLLPFSNFE